MPDPIAMDEWRPDLSSRINPTAEAKGVISVAKQYAPFPEIQDYSAAFEPNDEFTKVLLHFNGDDESTTFTDDNEGGSAHTWTAAGNAQIDTAESKFGGASGLFDGTGDFITTPDHADFVLGDDDFTIECWFNCTAATGAVKRLCGQTGASAGTDPSDFSFNIQRSASNVMRIEVSDGSTVSSREGTTQFTDALNTGWHHLAVVRTGNVIKLFLDGVQEGADLAFSGTIPDSANPLGIACLGGNVNNPWTGHIDEFRFSVGVARWLANFTPPAIAYVNNDGAAAGAVVQGAGVFYDDVTVPHVFSGDVDTLYHLESRVAVDRSQAGGYSLGAEDTWQFAQFGNNVVAVASTEDPQVFDMTASPLVAFADLTGSPPTGATSVARVGDFLWMGKDFTVHWSAFNDITDWVPDSGTQAGNQELDQEQGEIIALLGLDYAAIFQERAIRRAIYVGSPVIWDFGQDYVEKARGCIARNAAVAFGRIIFYASDDGFYAFDGQSSTPIGYGKIDDYFTRNLNYAYRHKISAGIDRVRKLVVFGFPTGGATNITEVLIFSIQDGRWTHDTFDLEFLHSMAAEPQTIDLVSGFWDQSIDAEPVASFDIDSGVLDDRRVRLAAWQATSHRLGLFTGAARPATVDTKEFEPAPGRRGLLTEVWPMGDMQRGDVSASIVYRSALPGAGSIISNATQMNAAGFCPQRVDARFMRARLQVSAGADWRRMEGVHFTASATGQR